MITKILPEIIYFFIDLREAVINPRCKHLDVAVAHLTCPFTPAGNNMTKATIDFNFEIVSIYLNFLPIVKIRG